MNTPTAVATTNAPAPVGPYSQALSTNGFLFCSGQIGLEPTTNTLVAGGAAAELTQALVNVEAVLAAAGLTKAAIVRVDLYVTDLSLWDEINSAYAAFFTAEPYPARVTVEVSLLPMGAAVEVACTAVTNH